jgi:preprotein translocase subunit SecD
MEGGAMIVRRSVLAFALLAFGPAARASAAPGSAFYVSAVDDNTAGLPGDRALIDLEGVRRWVSPAAFLTSRSLAEAHVRVNQPTGVLEVALGLTAQGARALRDYTTTHAGGRIAFVLDDTVLSAPVVVNRLTVDVIGIWDKTFDETFAERIAARIREIIAAEREGRPVPPGRPIAPSGPSGAQPAAAPPQLST